MDFAKYLHRPHLAISRRTSFCLIGIWAASPAYTQEAHDPTEAGTANQLLERFAAEVTDMTADFEQSQFDAEGELLDEIATGRFSLLRPDRFLWQQAEPFEKIFDADGSYLWTYDVELEQVERAPLSDLAESPMMLLSGEGTVSDGYAVSALPASDGMDWIELTPVDTAASDFLSARIAFDDGVPVEFELVDGLENLTRIEFFNVEVNPGLSPRLFQFDPPAGVDVVGVD